MKDTVISTHKWSVNVRNYMENTWTRLETVPEEMVVMYVIYMEADSAPTKAASSVKHVKWFK